jgi:hypothetical protein
MKKADGKGECPPSGAGAPRPVECVLGSKPFQEAVAGVSSRLICRQLSTYISPMLDT